ncbi:MAG: cation transporter [Clostridia bacterium]|nr:cation transporter [Clostridia bacterium]
MTKFFFKTFVKGYRDGEKNSPEIRRACGSAVSIVGIIANILLAAFKMLAGILSGAISITADAMNNLSDAGSQVVSFISFKISGKPADRDHPFGHARIEYVASMIVSFLVLLVGFELMTDSVGKIFNPEPTTYNALVIIILVASIAVKLWLFVFGRSAAKKINSEVVKAAATDSLSDAIATSAVLASIIICSATGFDTDGYMGVIVAVIVMIAGIKILNETKNSILGSAPEPELIEEIIRITREYPEALGIHDMVVHNYGPGNTIASFHVEVDGMQNVFHTHDVIDTIEKRLFSELSVRATVHMDPIVTDDERVNELREKVLALVKQIDERLDLHDFRFVEGVTHSNLIFDVNVPFEIKMSDDEVKRAISLKISELDPNYFAVMTVDRV